LNSQVTGVLTITSAAAPPFRKVCETCSKPDIIFSASGESYCNICRARKPAIKSAFLRATINTVSAEQVFISIAGKWLEAIVHQSAIEFLACPRPMQIKLLKNIRIRGTFTLSTTSYLVGFEEEEDTFGYELTPQHSQALGSIDLYQPQSTITKVDLQVTPLQSIVPVNFEATPIASQLGQGASSSKRKLFDEPTSSSKARKS
jgi:hypothetical protein